MDNYFVWLVAGFVLVIAELVSGTFYLLVLGVAAFAAAAVAWGGAGFAVEAVVAAVVALAGVAWVRHWRRGTVGDRMPSIDAGRPAVFETWTDRAAGRARVKYRDTMWDAVIDEPLEGTPGQVLYIVSLEGNTLRLTSRPAPHGDRQ